MSHTELIIANQIGNQTMCVLSQPFQNLAKVEVLVSKIDNDDGDADHSNDSDNNGEGVDDDNIDDNSGADNNHDDISLDCRSNPLTVQMIHHRSVRAVLRCHCRRCDAVVTSS